MGKKQKASKKPNKGAPASTAAGGDSKAERQKGGKQRRRGKEHQWETCELEKELATVGLRIKSIEPDGNCFFRAVLDQLEGEGGDHVGLRRRVMDHIEEQQEHYSLFIEDDEPFERYVKRMRKEGVWAGNMELVAASTLLQHSINIYQAGQPVWQISCAPDAPVLHLSYHDGMHYNSVRSAGDYGSGPPEPLRLGSIAAADPAAVAEAARSFGAAEVDRVVAGTGCRDRNRAAAVLERCGGDVDVAIEVLIEEMGKEGEQEAANGEADGCNGAAGDQRQQQEHQQQQQQQHEGLEPAPELQPGPQRQHAEGTGTHDRMAAGSEQQQQASAVQGSSTECVHLVQLELLPCRCDPERITAVLHTRPPDYQGQQGKQQLEEEQQEHEQEEQVAEPPRNKRGGGKKGGVKVKEAKIVAAGRNRRCPCGSTKKYKNCCGAVPKPAPAAVDAGEAARQLHFLHI